MRRLTTIVLALILVSSVASQMSAQEAVSADALKAAQKVAGSATVTRARFVAGDSLFIDVVDASFSLQAFEDGEWKFGGREEVPKEVGREVAEAILAGLPASSPVKIVLVKVQGTGGAAIQMHFRTAELRRPRSTGGESPSTAAT